VKPDPTAKTALLQRPAEHLLAGEAEKVGMPDDEESASNSGSRDGKGHPLGDPFGEIIHAVRDGSIDGIEIEGVGVCSRIGRNKLLRLTVIQRFIQNAMGWREGLH
jgi:hypothetical protein